MWQRVVAFVVALLSAVASTHAFVAVPGSSALVTPPSCGPSRTTAAAATTSQLLAASEITQENVMSALLIGSIALAGFVLRSPENADHFSDNIREYWDENFEKPSKADSPLVLESAATSTITATATATTPKKLTTLVKTVADKVEGKTSEINEKLQLATAYAVPVSNADVDKAAAAAAAAQRGSSKRKSFKRIAKKIVMPWRKWENL
jgi:hypothetical protein